MTISATLKTNLSEQLAEWYEKKMGMKPSEVKVSSEGKTLSVCFNDVIYPSKISLNTHKAGRKRRGRKGDEEKRTV